VVATAPVPVGPEIGVVTEVPLQPGAGRLGSRAVVRDGGVRLPIGTPAALGSTPIGRISPSVGENVPVRHVELGQV
jgi:hypothetical protein